MTTNDRIGNVIAVGDRVVWIGGYVARVKSITSDGIIISGCKDIVNPRQVVCWNFIEKES